MRKFILKYSILIAVIPIVFIVYRDSVRGGFFYDDFLEVAENPALKSGFADAIQAKPFRALPAVVYRLCYLTGATNPSNYHYANLIFHIMAAMILSILWIEIFKRFFKWPDDSSYRAGIAAGLFFAVHPLNVEAVSYISGLPDVMAAFFIFASCFFFIKSLQNRLKPIYYAAGLFFFVCGLFCKESAVIGAGAVFLIFIGGLYRPDKKSAKNILVAVLPLISVIAAWGVFRSTGKVDWGSAEHSAEGAISIAKKLWALGEYFSISIYPIGMNIDHGAAPENPAASIIFWAGVLSLFILTAAPIAFYKNRSGAFRASALVYALWISGIAFISFLPLADPIGERRVYMLTGAFAGLAAATFILAGNSEKNKIRANIATAIVACLFALSSVNYAATWSSETSIWANAVRWNTENARPWNHFGRALIETDRSREAEVPVKNSIELDPKSAKAWLNMGAIYMDADDMEAAKKAFEKTLALKPNEWRALLNLAIIEEKNRNYPQAAAYSKAATEIMPNHHTPWFNYGNILRAMQRYDDAIVAYQKALATNPAHAGSKINLALAYEDVGDLKAAEKELSELLRIDSENSLALFSLSRVEYNLGNYKSSADRLERYLKSNPNDPEGWRILSVVYSKLEMPQKSSEARIKYEASIRDAGK